MNKIRKWFSEHQKRIAHKRQMEIQKLAELYLMFGYVIEETIESRRKLRENGKAIPIRIDE